MTTAREIIEARKQKQLIRFTDSTGFTLVFRKPNRMTILKRNPALSEFLKMLNATANGEAITEDDVTTKSFNAIKAFAIEYLVDPDISELSDTEIDDFIEVYDETVWSSIIHLCMSGEEGDEVTADVAAEVAQKLDDLGTFRDDE